MAQCPACRFELKPGQGKRPLKEPARSGLNESRDHHTPCAERVEKHYVARGTQRRQNQTWRRA